MRDPGVIYDISGPAAAGTSFGLTVPSPDGKELFAFDISGRHVATRDALTNAVVATFGYDTAGRLVSIADEASNVTQVIRNSVGLPTAVVAPFGQRTELATNSAGFLSQIQPDPEKPPYLFNYVDELGLLQSMTDPNGSTYTYSYENGRLVSDQAPDGRGVTLNWTQVGDVTTVTVAETEGGTKTYVTDVSQPSKLISTVTFPDGTRTQSTQNTDGTTVTANPDGTTITRETVADPTLGSFAPVVSSTVTTPAGRQRTEVVSVTIVPTNALYDWTQARRARR